MLSFFKKYKKSLKYLDEIFLIVEKKKDFNMLIPIIVNTSSVYFSMKKYNKSFTLNKKALKFLEKINDVNYKPTILIDLAIYYKKNKKFNKALKLFKESLKINIDISAQNKIPNSHNHIADTLLDLNKIEDAIKHYKIAIQKSKNEVHLKSKIHALEKICELVDKNHKNYNNYYEMLIACLKEEVMIKDKIYNDENKNTILVLEAYIDNIEKEKENSKLKLQLENKKRELVTKKIKTLSENNFIRSIIEKLNKDSSKMILK